MEISIKKIGEEEKEYIEIGCHIRDERVDEIVRFIRSREGILKGIKEDRQYSLALPDILYIEAVDEKTFIYLENDCYESGRRLYEFEEVLSSRNFARISKSVVVNLMKITSIKPSLNGRFSCVLTNGEQVIISRKYVPDIREKLRGGAV
ncbi:MAG: LytTR family transcriptional regulator DNA-binding domain-containing protein [Clostridiales bacterium]|jgi:DNA-binding LytR/AlgR family response regulator|nr:LytTR family transcriptional regulator DNA-binding domain-containing protein [Clostridiales bacterium]